MLLGYLFLGDRPDRYMLLSASFIVVSGLYAFYRERKLASLRPAASAPRCRRKGYDHHWAVVNPGPPGASPPEIVRDAQPP